MLIIPIIVIILILTNLVLSKLFNNKWINYKKKYDPYDLILLFVISISVNSALDKPLKSWSDYEEFPKVYKVISYKHLKDSSEITYVWEEGRTGVYRTGISKVEDVVQENSIEKSGKVKIYKKKFNLIKLLLFLEEDSPETTQVLHLHLNDR